MSTYRTAQGDMLDAICLAHYGRVDVTPTVYAANPGLAAMGPVLPIGLVITLPTIESEPVAQPVRLWD